MDYKHKGILLGLALVLGACSSGGSSSSSLAEADNGGTDSGPDGPGGSSQVASTPASCANFVDEAYVTRNELAAGQRGEDAALVLRFIHLTDDHIIDDDGQAVAGASAIDPLLPQFESAMRLQEEYADEALNDMVTRINECDQEFPSDFAIVTGDSADLTTIAETRRYIDNLDGSFDQMSAFETACRAGLPDGTSEEVAQFQCTRFTGRGVADTQTPDQDPDNILIQPVLTRTLLQLAATEQAAITGRAADGSTDPSRQTITRAPGMPEVLRCESGTPDCINVPLAMPYLIAFGNHDGYTRGTVPIGFGSNEAAFLFGRHFIIQQNEFIDEFFFTQPKPGPIGHGFNFADQERTEDDDPRNDGYYAFDAADGRFRMIVMNTILDGNDPRLPTDLVRNPFALADGGMDREQFEWIQAELAQANANEQLVFVFSHHPDLSFAEFGPFAPLITIEVSAAELDAELASWPNVIAWFAGHTHVHRIRAFKVEDGVGSNGTVSGQVECNGPGPCPGFWQVETASLIDHPQQQRMVEVFDNGDGTGSIRGSVLTHEFEISQRLAEADDRCALYLTDPEAVQSALSDAGMDFFCMQGGTREGEPGDRNVDLIFAMPEF